MDKIYNEYYEKIYHWALSKTNNKEDAEDLTNNVFLAIFEYLNKDINVNKLEHLIWKIAYNIWCTKAKFYIKEKDISAIKQDYPVKSIEMVDKIIYKEIVNNLDNIGLTSNEKKAFTLYYINDLSIKEISKYLNIKEPNIKYYLFSAKKK